MRTPPYLKRINGWDDKDHQEHEEEQQAEQQEEERKTKKRQRKSNDNKNWTTLNHVLISGTLPNYMT